MAFAFIYSVSIAQVKVRPGLKSGSVLSSISGIPNSSEAGFFAGVFVNIRFSKKYNLRPELTYSKQGSREFGKKDKNIDIGYLSLSLANKFYPIKNTKLSLTVGPSIDLMTNRMILLSNYNPKYLGFIPGDVSLFGAIGYDLPFGLGVELRYKQGFVDIYGRRFAPGEPTEEYIDKLNQVFQIGLVYQFNF